MTSKYDPTQIFKIVMHVDGTLLDVELPEGAEPTDCKGEIRNLLASLTYGESVCNPPCVFPKKCVCLIQGGVRRCWCR
jgi:hypothetical protein